MKHPPAFFLLEVFLATTILLFIFYIVLPRSTTSTILLANEHEKLFLTFSFLQQKAIASHAPQTMTFTTTTNQYVYYLGNKKIINTLPSQIKFGYLENSKGPPTKPSKYICRAITFPHKESCFVVTFFANGTITPGTVYLVDQRKKSMKALTCAISQVSYIRKYDYQQKKWALLPQ